MIALPLFVITAFIVSGGFQEGLQHFQQVRASHWGWFSLSMLASYGLGDVLFLWSTRSLGVPGALAIASSYPIWTLLAGYFLENEAITRSQSFGLVVTLCGLMVVILNAPQPTASESAEVDAKTQKAPAVQFSWMGVFLAFMTSVAWATNSFSVSRGGADLLPPVGNVIRMISALVLSTCFAKIFEPRSSLLLPSKTLSKFMWLFVLDAFIGSYLYMYGLSRSPLALGATLASLAPVISVPLAWLLKTEKFSIFRTLGVCLAVLGVCFLVGTLSF
jgi:drug/metabolite transporter (DMT)-like permease